MAGVARSLLRAVEVGGVALHSGVRSHVALCPARAGEGVSFLRTDLPSLPSVTASPRAVVRSELAVVLGCEGGEVSTVEHLMAALLASRVSACRVEVSGPELPLLDGSASPWVEAIRSAGVVEVGGESTRPLTVSEPVCVHEGDAWLIALPSASPRLTYGIDFPSHPSIGRQWHSWAPGGHGSFADEIAPARTFALREQIDSLRAKGLIKGGSLENALVCDQSGWINGPTRFPNEPVHTPPPRQHSPPFSQHCIFPFVLDVMLCAPRLARRLGTSCWTLWATWRSLAAFLVRM